MGFLSVNIYIDMIPNITKSELARRMGKSRQQINVLLDEEKKNNFTIETMARISTALGQRLVVRLLPDNPEA